MMDVLGQLMLYLFCFFLFVCQLPMSTHNSGNELERTNAGAKHCWLAAGGHPYCFPVLSCHLQSAVTSANANGKPEAAKVRQRQKLAEKLHKFLNYGLNFCTVDCTSAAGELLFAANSRS
jgi:hypothetical protein